VRRIKLDARTTVGVSTLVARCGLGGTAAIFASIAVEGDLAADPVRRPTALNPHCWGVSNVARSRLWDLATYGRSHCLGAAHEDSTGAIEGSDRGLCRSDEGVVGEVCVSPVCRRDRRQQHMTCDERGSEVGELLAGAP